MAEPVLGVLYAAENVLEAGLLAAKGLLHPTLPLKATLSRISDGPNLPRTGHSISVIKNRAYVFGGESSTNSTGSVGEGAGQAADADVHVIVLPASDVETTDYFTVQAKSQSPGGRKSHTATAVGDGIYIFGGQPLPSSSEQDSPGRIHIFSTLTSTWSYRSPSPNTPTPRQRTGHAAAGTDVPDPSRAAKKRGEGPDTSLATGILPQQPPDPASDALYAEPAAEGSYGTVFILGGQDAESGEQLDDAWAYDVRTNRWTQLPSLPARSGDGKIGAAVVGKRLYVHGAFEGAEGAGAGRVMYLDIRRALEFAKQENQPSSPEQVSLLGQWQAVTTSSMDGRSSGPSAEQGVGLVDVTTGQGRHYLLLLAGADRSHNGDAKDKIYALQLPSEPESAAAMKDATRETMGRDTKKHTWAEVQYQYVDVRGEVVPAEKARAQGLGMGRRKGAAVAKGAEVDGASIVVWGGVDEEGRMMGDGWMITVER